MIFLRFLNTDWRNYAILALAGLALWFYVLHIFDRGSLAECAAERAAIIQVHEQFKASAKQASEKAATEAKKRVKRLDKNLKEISNEASCNNPVSQCLSGALRMYDAASGN